MDAQKHNARANKHWQAGTAHARAGRWPLAAQEFERAVKMAPLDAVYHLNLARAQARLNHDDAAIDAARRSFELDPASPLACRFLADFLSRQYRHAEAVSCYERLDPLAPRDHDFYSAYGVALFNSGRLKDAIEVFFKALALKIDAPLVHYRMGLAFKDLNMKEEASECFRTAVLLDEGSVRAMALSLLVHESAQACRWDQIDEETAALREAMRQVPANEGDLLSPFALIPIECPPAEQRHVGMLRAQALGRALPRLPALPRQRLPGRIRLGYLSSDFYNHATAVLMAELLEHRDSSQFEVILYSHSRDDGSDIRRRVMAACDRFVEVSALSGVALSQRIRADAIDIVVDLKGHTRDSRFEVLAARPAPLQVSYLGYPGTTGADYIDYLIGDPVVTPLSAAADFSEKIAQMPWSYQPNDRQRALPASPGRAACGLPTQAMVLCCFNQAYKITPHVADIWARILRQATVPTVLWLLSWNDQAERNLVSEFQRRGIGRDQLIFAPKLDLEQHLARLQCADLFLDTWPCNAHTTASEALWMGVPVVTLSGATFASRVAASLARASKTEELVCESPDHYVDTIAALMHDPAQLQRIRQTLTENRWSCPLFDSQSTARELESLFLRMHQRHLQGLPPAHLLAGDQPG